MARKREITGMYEVLDALRVALESAEPAKRKHLRDVLNAYAKDFPDEYFWATGPQAPVLLHHLMIEIDAEPSTTASRAGDTSKNGGPSSKTPTAFEVGRMVRG